MQTKETTFCYLSLVCEGFGNSANQVLRAWRAGLAQTGKVDNRCPEHGANYHQKNDAADAEAPDEYANYFRNAGYASS